jgi:hypothetical protein
VGETLTLPCEVENLGELPSLIDNETDMPVLKDLFSRTRRLTPNYHHIAIGLASEFISHLGGYYHFHFSLLMSPLLSHPACLLLHT